jgi:hypothetical protein
MQGGILKKFLNIGIIVLLIMVTHIPAFATGTTYYSQGNGTFSTTGNWNTIRLGGGSTPGDIVSADSFIVQSGHTITLNTSTNQIIGLTVESGGIFNHSTFTLFVSSINGAAAVDIQSGGTYDEGSGKIEFFKALGSAPTFTLQAGASEIFNDITLRDGALNMNASSAITYRINGKLLVGLSAGTITTNNVSISYGPNAEIEYAPSSGYTIGAEWTGSLPANNVTVNMSGFTLSGGTTSRTIRRNLALTAGTIDLGSSTILTVRGNISGSTVSGSGTIDDNTTLRIGDGDSSSVAQSITGNINLNSFEVNKSGGGGGSESAANTATCSGQLIFNASGSLTVTAGTLEFSSSGRLGTDDLGTLTLTVSSGGVLKTGGQDLTAIGTISAASGKIVYNSTTGSETLVEDTEATVGTLEVNNGSGVQASSGTLTIGTELILSNGVVSTTSSNLLEIASTATITGASDSRYIYGPLTKNFSGAGTFHFPVGDASAYRPVLFEVTSGSGDFTVEYATTNPNVGNTPSLIKSISNNRKWTVTPASGSTFNIDVIYTSPGFTIGNENFMRILRGTSGSSDWVDADTTPNPLDTTEDSIGTDIGLSESAGLDNYTVAEAQGGYTWTGASSNDVTDQDNWSPTGVPGSGDAVSIATGTPNITQAVTWGTLTISSNANVTITTNSTSALTLNGGSGTVLSIAGTGQLNATTNPSSSGTVVELTGTGELSVTGGSMTFSGANNTGLGDGAASALPTSRQSYASGTTFTYNGDGSGFQSQTYGNFVLDPTSAASVAGFTVNNSFTKNNTNASTFTITSGELAVAQTFTNNGGLVVNGTGVTVNLDGSGTQSVSGSTSTTFYNLTKSNSGDVNLSQDVTVDNQLGFSSNGVINTGGNTLTIGSSGQAISGANSSRYVDGSLAKIFPTGSSLSYVFETGDGGEYLPLTMSFGNVSTSGTVTAQQNNGTPPSGSISGLSKISSVRYWDLTNSGTVFSSPQVILSYNANDAVDQSSAELRIAQRSGGVWGSIGGTGTGMPSGTITSSGMTGFGDGYVTFGDAVGLPDNSLPVALSYFDADISFASVRLQWTTESELNNNGFNIYRRLSEEDADWQLLNQELILGQGNTAISTDYEFIDSDIQVGAIYLYKLESVSFSGDYITEQIVEISIPMPSEYALLNNYPNPFNPTTHLKFQLPADNEVTINIYNIAGNLVKKLISGQKYPAGEHVVGWDATDNSGQQLASGQYFYRFRAGDFIKTGKMILLK